MKRMASVLAVFAMFCLAAGASAVQTNLGQDLPLPGGHNDLTDPASVTSVGMILYAPSEADDPAYRAAVSAAASGAVVDYYDASAGTPDAALLSNYSCVITWANFAYADPITYGNNLAAFVDAGGHVVLGPFTVPGTGFNTLDGTIMTVGYSPVAQNGGNAFTSATYVGDGTTCIHDNVFAYECIYRDYLVTQGAGLVDGTYSDGLIAHAYRPDFAVIYSNGSGAFPLLGTGDWAQLHANACSCSGSSSTDETSWGRVKSIFR